MPVDTDILMITHRRPHYTRMSLDRLARQCEGVARLWIWHNGDHAETREIVESFADHPSVHRVHVNPDNAGLVPPTNWLWSESSGRFVSKVDDDCLLPDGWIETLAAAHDRDPELGVIGCCRLLPEDLIERYTRRKVVTRPSGVELYRSCWVQGSGYSMKRACIDRLGLLGGDNPTSFTVYCTELARAGFVNGFLWPLLLEDHMDDPRSPNSALRSDEDLAAHLPLTALRGGVKTLDQWTARVKENARQVQMAPVDPAWYYGWRFRLRNGWLRLRTALLGQRPF
jgi:glycosyltransferase involved in cell wall biosynthesis